MLSENSGHCRQVIAIRMWSITQVLQCLFLKLHMLGVFAFVCVGMCNLLLVYWCACVAVHVCVCVFFCAFIEYKRYLLSDVTVQTPGWLTGFVVVLKPKKLVQFRVSNFKQPYTFLRQSYFYFETMKIDLGLKKNAFIFLFIFLSFLSLLYNTKIKNEEEILFIEETVTFKLEYCDCDRLALIWNSSFYIKV